MRRALAILFLGLALGCDDGRRYEQAVAVLIDVSGTYADQKETVVSILKREVLPALVPGDTLLVLRIDSQSYEQANVEALVRLDPRPSRSNAQKLGLARRLDAFARDAASSEYTDIPGAMMLAAEYLHEIESGSRAMLVFSDLAADLPEGARRSLGEREFEGIHLAALNVKRLGSDGADPARFRARLATWEGTATRAGAVGWRTLQDASQLAAYLEEIRG